MVTPVDEELLIDHPLDVLLAEVREQAGDVDGPVASPCLPAAHSAEPLQDRHRVEVKRRPPHRGESECAQQALRRDGPAARPEPLGLLLPELGEPGPVQVHLLEPPPEHLLRLVVEEAKPARRQQPEVSVAEAGQACTLLHLPDQGQPLLVG